MAIDQRDWWVNKLRKKQRYKERAKFRVNIGQAKRRAAWKAFWIQAGVALLAIIVMMAAIKQLMRG